jgi:hypothetical protein
MLLITSGGLRGVERRFGAFRVIFVQHFVQHLLCPIEAPEGLPISGAVPFMTIFPSQGSCGLANIVSNARVLRVACRRIAINYIAANNGSEKNRRRCNRVDLKLTDDAASREVQCEQDRESGRRAPRKRLCSAVGLSWKLPRVCPIGSWRESSRQRCPPCCRGGGDTSKKAWLAFCKTSHGRGVLLESSRKPNSWHNIRHLYPK